MNEYDVILLGSGLGGLIAATFLARQKRKVLLLKEKGAPFSHEKEGYRFAPFSNFSERLLRPSLVKKICGALNLPGLTCVRGQESRPDSGDKASVRGRAPFQVILPSARVDLFHERAKS